MIRVGARFSNFPAQLLRKPEFKLETGFLEVEVGFEEGFHEVEVGSLSS